MSHTCRSLLFHCIDFRLQKDIKRFMEEQKMLGNADIVSLAGAAKNFLDTNTRTIALRQLEISKTLHWMTEMHLMNHTDCGAYGGKAAFQGPEAEHRKHAEDLAAAAQIIHETFPDLTVIKWIARLEEQDGHTRVRFETIF